MSLLPKAKEICRVALLSGPHQLVIETGFRPQATFANPKGYPLAPEHDTEYCRFRVPAPKGPGVYLWRVDRVQVYIGRAKSLLDRLSRQYGCVSPRHPYRGGQLQKCWINAKICAAVNAGCEVTVEWEETPHFIAREKELLSAIRPSWNRRFE